MNPNLDYLKGYMQNANERKLLAVLAETNRVIYDWGHDEIWVWPAGKPFTPKNSLHMSGEVFHWRMAKADKSTVTGGGNSFGFVVNLLSLGLDVQIARRRPYLRRKKLQEMRRCAKRDSKTGKIGSLIQFLPRYAK